MFETNNYAPTKVIFGANRLEELGVVKLPGNKALSCITEGGSVRKYGTLQKVIGLLKNKLLHRTIN